MLINLEHVSSVKQFIAISQDISSEVLLKSGRYIVDGKSILGVFSLDLSKPIELICDECDISKFEQFKVTE